MENGGAGKRYRCYYCNAHFFQNDAWQRHNRKHTAVEIECDDCGEMMSNHLELRNHQRSCTAMHVYSSEAHMEKESHETPDSTSKQEPSEDDDSALDHLIGRDPNAVVSDSESEMNNQEGRLDAGVIKVSDNKKDHLEVPSYDQNTVSPANSDSHLSENGDNQKYQPYFCKNCGARFTRKDSVTRHLKKGTCGGKAAIVCSVCGKIFVEVFALHDHFKSQHKDAVFPPKVTMPTIRPPIENLFQPHIDRPRLHATPSEENYSQIGGAIKASHKNSNSFQPHANYARGNDIPVPTQHRPLQSTSQYPPIHEISRKREYRRHEMDTYDQDHQKYMKLTEDRHFDHPVNHLPHRNINLSEYTTSAINTKQYYDKHQHSPVDEPVNLHQCKTCGLEFPRFDYLLTHLRKHREKNEEKIEDDRQEQNDSRDEKESFQSDHNSTSSEERKPFTNFTPHIVTTSSNIHENIPVIVPPQGMNSHYEGKYVHQSPQIPDHIEAITPGIDGKFRPFICENCGQRFTRKDSLVRHSRKLTCFEDMTELKCPDCEKTFRYHKCLAQHQELVHGIKRANIPSDDEGSESGRSDPSFEAEKKTKDVETHAVSPTMQPPSQLNTIRPGLFPSQAILPSIENQRSIKFSQEDKVSGLAPPVRPTKDAEFSVSYGYCMVPRPFQCEYCGDRFAHRHSLKRHVRRHLGIGIPCHDCGKLYRDQSEWRRHQRSIHNRHYEKADVPTRISFRDSIEQGLVSATSNNNSSDGQKRQRAEESESEHSDGEHKPTMINKEEERYEEMRRNELLRKRQEEFQNKENENVVDRETSEDSEQKNVVQEGDKDSRKSVLDSYLFSDPHVEKGTKL